MNVVSNNSLATSAVASLSSSLSLVSSLQRMDEGTNIKSNQTPTNEMIDNISCNSNIEQINPGIEKTSDLMAATSVTTSSLVAMNGSGAGNSNCFKSINSAPNKTANISNSTNAGLNNNNSEIMTASGVTVTMANISSGDNLQWYDFLI